MIKVTKKEIPQILLKNQQTWTSDLIMLLNKYKNFGNIPEKEKNDAVNKYRAPEIKTAIIDSTKGKCVYCESFIEGVDYTNIEHFHPKSLYPKYTFKWSNLFPACRKCNIPKNNYDTKSTPIVHPAYDNGEDFFNYVELRIQISTNAPDKVKAQNTIDACNLDRISLCRLHSEILISFYEVEENINSTINHYNKLVQNASKLSVSLKLLEAIDNLKNQSKYSKQHAGFLRFIIRNSNVIGNAIDIINKNSIDLGVNGNYDFEWNVSA